MTSEVDVRNRRKASQKRVSSPGKRSGDDSTFVNRELSSEEVRAYRAWRQDTDAIDLIWREAIDDGYKFTIRFDERNNCSVCFMFPAEGHDNHGFILTGRGGTPLRAIAECIYKHSFLFGGAWFEATGGPSGPDDPDW